MKCFIFLSFLFLIFCAPLNASDPPFSADCSCKGFPLKGRVRVVDNAPDLRVQLVDNAPDIRVMYVSRTASSCGEWQIVDNAPDLRVQIVDNAPDIRVQIVDNAPGIPHPVGLRIPV